MRSIYEQSIPLWGITTVFEGQNMIANFWLFSWLSKELWISMTASSPTQLESQSGSVLGDWLV